jgi:hypothetical protein
MFQAVMQQNLYSGECNLILSLEVSILEKGFVCVCFSELADICWNNAISDNYFHHDSQMSFVPHNIYKGTLLLHNLLSMHPWTCRTVLGYKVIHACICITAAVLSVHSVILKTIAFTFL